MKHCATGFLLAFAVCFPSATQAVTWHVPSQCPTIQAGVDSAAAWDTVLVAPGVYHDCTHANTVDDYLACVNMKHSICLRSETGDPSSVIIDAEGLGRGIFCNGVGSRLEGVTVTGADAMGSGAEDMGGAVFCRYSNMQFRDCIFLDNTAAWGAGIYCEQCSPEISACRFAGNIGGAGPGVCCREYCHAAITDCDFLNNASSSTGCQRSPKSGH